jgi:hypothetical protein
MRLSWSKAGVRVTLEGFRNPYTQELATLRLPSAIDFARRFQGKPDDGFWLEFANGDRCRLEEV